MFKIITECHLVTLEGETFFKGSFDDFKSIAIAGFEKLIELYKNTDDPDVKIAIKVMVCSYIEGEQPKPAELQGYLGWNPRPKL
jgi:hypothetical protein